MEGLVVTIVAVLFLLLQMINTLLSKRQDQKTASAILRVTEKLDDCQQSINDMVAVNKQMYDMHNHVDQDGIPLWYMPRSWTTAQKDIVEICRQISNTQVLLVQAMERLEAKIN